MNDTGQAASFHSIKNVFTTFAPPLQSDITRSWVGQHWVLGWSSNPTGEHLNVLQAFSACATLVCTSGRESGWKSVWESCPKSGGASEQLPTTCLRSGSDSQVLLLLQRAFLRVAEMVKVENFVLLMGKWPSVEKLGTFIGAPTHNCLLSFQCGGPFS